MVTSTLDVGVPSSGRRVACDRSRFAIISELRPRHVVKPLIENAVQETLRIKRLIATA